MAVTWFNDPNSRSWALPESFRDDDVRLSEAVIERYVMRFTNAGDCVFDPFAGYGTVLVVAERLGRTAVGYEVIEARARYANSLLKGSGVRVGDVRSADLGDIRATLILSSPPYMNQNDVEDPLTGYTSPVQSYEDYIEALASIYIQVGKVLSPGGHLVIQLQNLRNEFGVTPLAFDLYGAIGAGLRFAGEEVTTWDNASYGYTHGYCLIYTGA